MSFQDSGINVVDGDTSKGNSVNKNSPKEANGGNRRRSQQSPPKYGGEKGQYSKDREVSSSLSLNSSHTNASEQPAASQNGSKDTTKPRMEVINVIKYESFLLKNIKIL